MASKILPWAKTKVNFVRKWKIFIYLSKSISSPSKYSPLDIMQSCQRFFQSSKHFLNSISGIAFKAFFDSACISSIVSKWSRRTSAMWAGALSWCKNHELSAQNIFWNGVEWSSWNSNSVSKVSTCQSTIFMH